MQDCTAGRGIHYPPRPGGSDECLVQIHCTVTQEALQGRESTDRKRERERERGGGGHSEHFEFSVLSALGADGTQRPPDHSPARKHTS